MSDDVDDEFRQIVASQLADLDVESLDELDVWDTPSGSPSEPAVPGRDQPPAASTDQPPAPPRDQPVAPPRDRPVAPSPGRPSVPPQPPVRSMPAAIVTPPPASPRSWTPPPEPDDFVPPPPLPPAKRPSAVAWAAISSIASGLVLLAGVVLRILAGSWATPVGFLMVCSGLVVLFTRLPRDRDPGPDNGAKV